MSMLTELRNRVGAGNAFGGRWAASIVRFEMCGGVRRGEGGPFVTWVGRCQDGSGGLAVLVDESGATGVSSDRSARPVRDDFASVGGALAEAAVGPVGVVLLDIFA